MKIVLLESLGIPAELLKSYADKLEAKGHTFAAYEKNTDAPGADRPRQDADVIMIANMPLKGEVIRACQELKVHQRLPSRAWTMWTLPPPRRWA